MASISDIVSANYREIEALKSAQAQAPSNFNFYSNNTAFSLPNGTSQIKITPFNETAVAGGGSPWTVDPNGTQPFIVPTFSSSYSGSFSLTNFFWNGNQAVFTFYSTGTTLNISAAADRLIGITQ